MATSRTRRSNFSLIDLSFGPEAASQEYYPYVYVVQVTGDVTSNWSDRLGQELRKVTKDLVGAKFVSYELSKVGKGISIHATKKVADVIKKAAKKAVVAKPDLTFQVVKADDKTIKIFYRGSVSRLTLPKAPEMVSARHFDGDKSVVISTINELYPITDEFVEQVQAALQAASIAES